MTTGEVGAMKCFRVGMACWFLGVGSICAQDGHGYPMLSLQTVSNLHASAVLRIDRQCTDEKVLAGSNYVVALSLAEDVLKQAGNAVGWSSIRKEKNRYQSESLVPDVTSTNLPGPVAEAQADYRKGVAGAEYSRTEKYARLLESTLTRLDAARKNHEAMGQADLVRATLDYRARLGQELTLQRARLAATSGSKPVKKRPVNPPPR